MSVSFTFVTFALLCASASALQSAAQLRIDSNQEEGSEGESNGNEEGVDHANDFYKIWYDTDISRSEPTVHEEHDVPAEELADKFDPQTQIIGGDAAVGGSTGLEEEAEIPGGITFGEQPSSGNASAEETDPMQQTGKEKTPEGNATRKAQAAAQDGTVHGAYPILAPEGAAAESDAARGENPSAAPENVQAAAVENVIHGVDEFAEPEKAQPAEEENAVHGVDEFAPPPTAAPVTFRAPPETETSQKATAKKADTEASLKKADRALAVLLGKQDATATVSGGKADNRESPGAKEASEQKAQEAFAKLLGTPGEAEQAISSAVLKPNDVPLDLAREAKAIEKSTGALVWNPSKYLYSFCNVSRATLLFFGVFFVIMATGTVDFLVQKRRSKHQSPAYDVTGTHVSEDHLEKNVPPKFSGPLVGTVEDDAKGSEEDSLIEIIEDDAKESEEDSSMDILKAPTSAPIDEEQAKVPKQEAVVLKHKAALTGTSWLSRKMGLICYAR
mmetsp:Transcript_29192/g.51036  ORF Transcript_29192/g.51036 Transcript_29192/m.51036 type:complete len:503 (-) Transcript_29192:22-1530(-)